MQYMRPVRFAIIDSNILACLGLQQMLNDLLPMAEIVVFNSLDELIKQEDVSFIHYFVSSSIYFERYAFFQEQYKKTIVLVNGDMNIKDAFTLNICQPEKDIIHDLMALRNRGQERAMMLANQVSASTQLLTPRETEVAALLCRGLINKEIAKLMKLSLTTVISHRKNIMEKLEARSLADIIIYCILHGIVSMEDLKK